MFNHFPTHRPDTPLLDSIDSPAQLRLLDIDQLPQLANELREFLLYSVSQSGGHFGAGLGVIELTIALHYVYETPNDRLVWDVGHQTYPHKILTGRREQMTGIRHAGGLSGFPKRSESEYDTFGVGHSSTSISAALGMALAGKKSCAIIGDGALTAGMAFEAINHAADKKANMLVVLNDNQMSISKSSGGLSTYLSKIWASPSYNSLRNSSKKVLSKLPSAALEIARRTEEHMKGFISPGTVFEELGFNYIGPVDGHDVIELVGYLRNLRDMPGPQLLHIMTTKGKGFAPAEADPVGYHAITKLEPKNVQDTAEKATGKQKYQDVFGDWLCDTAAADEKLIGITPAMGEGSGMIKFSQRYPLRYHDVAIAEQHAVTVAGGMACDGLKPVVAIYSTFLQRGYDQLIHDIALQNLDVLFAIDRAGIVGEDGATHTGSFDLSFMRCIPNMVIMAPSNEDECRKMLTTGYHYCGPAAVRYPRGTGPGTAIESALDSLEIGKGRIVSEGTEVVILAFGSLVGAAVEAAAGLQATVVDMRFVKPLDTELISRLSDSHRLIVTVEENTICGGAGSAINEYLNQQGIVMPVLNLGLSDQFPEHGKPKTLLRKFGLDSDGIADSIRQRLALLD
ncbi:1-deoxy-D-xylulose-5-phosphate synthase [Sinobacterium norvegicum]|uniref:1-deoxy-D-xylulose-5-phosphate synthase n=1 Tax=Sinobacterium norvegicum TaxID=1641715 RepID=A0ABM9AEB0_9GAMM|nr:1-deoxy-D-xylulose-5-phosphate synthase [Sinobacterium norvegicum]CAH0991543.1 1-deoxy-D-xylulose-5-phosphate synthase [Sinobacterium norvegicum]